MTFERAVERRFGIVADVPSNPRDGIVGVQETCGGQLQSPVRQVLDGGNADCVNETFRQLSVCAQTVPVIGVSNGTS